MSTTDMGPVARFIGSHAHTLIELEVLTDGRSMVSRLADNDAFTFIIFSKLRTIRAALQYFRPLAAVLANCDTLVSAILEHCFHPGDGLECYAGLCPGPLICHNIRAFTMGVCFGTSLRGTYLAEIMTDFPIKLQYLHEAFPRLECLCIQVPRRVRP